MSSLPIAFSRETTLPTPPRRDFLFRNVPLVGDGDLRDLPWTILHSLISLHESHLQLPIPDLSSPTVLRRRWPTRIDVLFSVQTKVRGCVPNELLQ